MERDTTIELLLTNSLDEDNNPALVKIIFE